MWNFLREGATFIPESRVYSLGISHFPPQKPDILLGQFLEMDWITLHTCVSQLTAEDAFKLEDRVEASMIQLQADLHEAKSRNIYLNDLVEEQKRQAVTTY